VVEIMSESSFSEYAIADRLSRLRQLAKFFFLRFRLSIAIYFLEAGRRIEYVTDL
jgi:hypothetical protein